MIKSKSTFSFAVALLLAATVQAQPPGDRPGPPGGFPGPGGNPGGPPGFHLMTALDADKDGKISAKEIENAVAVLKALDKNQDGKLSQEEIGWPPAFGGFGPGGPGGPGPGGIPGFGGEPRPQRPDPDQTVSREPGNPSPNENRPRNTFFTTAQLKRLDRDQDGKITKEEVPQSVREVIFTRADTNKDGVIDADELTKLEQPASPEPKE